MDKLRAEELYYLMVLGQQFKYAAKEHYMQGEISGFSHLNIGQEALSVAAMKAYEMGFEAVVSGALARSSYRADAL